MNDVLNFLSELMVTLYQPMHVLAVIVGLVFTISGVMDLSIDFTHMFWLIRRFFIRKEIHPLTIERLKAREQQRVAIFIAAWHEEDVIAKTLTNACQTIHYNNFDIFVGTYPNDPDTQREVDKVAQINAHVHKVITPDPGPTNKAANLNHVFNAILDYETRVGSYFDIIVMHDSEDVIHPYSLLVYNYLMPRKEMIQIPVFPLPQPLRRVTHWTYADEFAENHTKILRVRELNNGFVPSAGVGTAFTKRAFQQLAISTQEIFSPNTLTEDYQLGLRMNLQGMNAAFVNIRIPPSEAHPTEKAPKEWIATRALFPTDFKHAVKQKTRWNIGIILQSWKNIGWEGSLGVKWDLMQDRKALISTPVNFLGYLVFLYFVLYQLVQYFSGATMPVLISKGSFLYILVFISTIFMAWRLVNRALAVNKIYGFWPAVTSIPRSIWGNVINFSAITRAIYQYFDNKLKKREVAWDKTAHEFPSIVTGEDPKTEKKEGEKTYDIFHLPFDLVEKNFVRMFSNRLESEDKWGKVRLLENIPREYGTKLFPYFNLYLSDPDWEVRAAVCRSLSFLLLPQSIPYLKTAASDQDWVVRSNAVRALGKFGSLGEAALLSILDGEDNFARDAARTILEQQGFLDQHLIDLEGPNFNAKNRARHFFIKMANLGQSSIAKEVVKKFDLDEKPSDTKDHHETGVGEANYPVQWRTLKSPLEP
jgi:bacteriophage N4 adsorption protein B